MNSSTPQQQPDDWPADGPDNPISESEVMPVRNHKAEIMAGLAGEFEQRCHELMGALKKAHNAMFSWFSSEYADHPTSKEVAAEIVKGIVPIKRKEVMPVVKKQYDPLTSPETQRGVGAQQIAVEVLRYLIQFGQENIEVTKSIEDSWILEVQSGVIECWNNGDISGLRSKDQSIFDTRFPEEAVKLLLENEHTTA